MIEFVLNDRIITTNKPNGSLLLDFIRYDKSLTGTKIGCREGDCGACTVLVGELTDNEVVYRQITSCLTPIGNVAGKHVVTIEGLNVDELTPVQQAMIDNGGTQCGFCTVGFVVSLSGFCITTKNPTFSNAIEAIDGNICRCTGYKSIERAANQIAELLEEKDFDNSIPWLISQGFIPTYFKTIPEKLKKLQTFESEIEPKKIVGGGTDLYVQQPDNLVDLNVDLISDMSWLKGVKLQDNQIIIGAGVTVTELMESEEMLLQIPNFLQFMKLVSSSPIRNISTIAGNFVNASPIGDLTSLFLALNSKIKLVGDSSERTIFLKDFYLGYKELDKRSDEIIEEIAFETFDESTFVNFEKVSTRIHLDIASVNSAIKISVKNNMIVSIDLSAGGIGPIPTYLTETCNFLTNKELTKENILHGNEIIQSEISPISDVRGTENYKRLLLRQLYFAHFITLFPNQFKLESFV